MLKDVDSTEKAKFAFNLIRLRRSNNLSQKAFSRLMEKSDRAVRRWESPDDSTWPKPYLLPHIAKILNCSIDNLFDIDSEHIPQSRKERDILNVARKSPRNLPINLITSAVSMLVLKMDKDQRMAWMNIGQQLVKNNKNK